MFLTSYVVVAVLTLSTPTVLPATRPFSGEEVITASVSGFLDSDAVSLIQVGAPELDQPATPVTPGRQCTPKMPQELGSCWALTGGVLTKGGSNGCLPWTV